jgi:hypothetical protein
MNNYPKHNFSHSTNVSFAYSLSLELANKVFKTMHLKIELCLTPIQDLVAILTLRPLRVADVLLPLRIACSLREYTDEEQGN